MSPASHGLQSCLVFQGCGQNLGLGPWASPWATLWATLWGTLWATLWATPQTFFLIKIKNDKHKKK